MKNISIIIPCLNPDEKLIEITKKLIQRGFSSIIIVDDGSNNTSKEYFDIVGQFKECTVLKHYINLGKGRALKTAFNYYLNNLHNNIGVITVDADNQHDIEDICKCAIRLSQNHNSLILGCRDFNENSIPAKSRYGNKLTRLIFKGLCGINVSDTQTGLRAIPTGLIEKFLDLDGERYEYETNMLIEAKKKEIPIEEIAIKTIYIENNKSSHFNPLKDSIKIYMLIFKFFSSSILSAAIDISIFAVLGALLSSYSPKITLLIATAGARIISSMFNFLVNKKLVFKHSSNTRATLCKYYILAVIQMSLSYLGVYFISHYTSLNPNIVKIFVDLILFFISFQIQREWVYKK